MFGQALRRSSRLVGVIFILRHALKTQGRRRERAVAEARGVEHPGHFKVLGFCGIRPVRAHGYERQIGFNGARSSIRDISRPIRIRPMRASRGKGELYSSGAMMIEAIRRTPRKPTNPTNASMIVEPKMSGRGVICREHGVRGLNRLYFQSTSRATCQTKCSCRTALSRTTRAHMFVEIRALVNKRAINKCHELIFLCRKYGWLKHGSRIFRHP